MKLIYVSLICVLVTMNSAFAILCDKEGPSGEYNRYFFLRKETVINHLGSVKPRHPYGMVQPDKPLVIGDCEYDLWGFMRGAIGENLKTDPTIEWIVFENQARSPREPLEHWNYICHPPIFDQDNGVTFELHKKRVSQRTPVCSSSSKN